MLDYQNQFNSDDIQLIVGVDEAGRGPLAGPVVAAAVVFSHAYINEEINDSKQLSAKKREKLFEVIKRDAVAFGISVVDADTIDRVNIYEATKIAMKDAISQIKVKYDLILTDAMPLMGMKTPVIDIIKGDAKVLAIAAASILAKVTRDHLLDELDKQYPQYGFAKHKGYGTKIHMNALKEYGPIPHIHRQSFKPVMSAHRQQMNIFDQ